MCSESKRKEAMILIPTEQQEAETLAAYLQLKGYDFHHSPNETGSDPAARRRAIRMKRAGVSRGFPDYLIYTNGHRIAIELKRIKGGSTSKEQREWLTVLSKYGYNTSVCKGANEAIQFIERVVN